MLSAKWSTVWVIGNTYHQMDASAIFGIVLLGLGILFVLSLPFVFIRLRRKDRHKQNDPVSYETELPELQDYGAFVREKHAALMQTGSPKEPSHKILFTVDFTLENGETKSVSVPQEAFERIHKGQSGTLVMQEDKFFDFQ